MKNEILYIIANTSAKHVSGKIKRTPHLMGVISECFGSNIAEQTYNFLHEDSRVCQYKNDKQFTSLVDGYRNCGKAATCRCTREQVSNSVSISKSKTTIEENLAINKKREETNIRVYGVGNTGQTEKAKLAHKLLYDDGDKVAILVNQVANTKLERYGDKNYNNPLQIASTFKKNHPIEYWEERYDNENLRFLQDEVILAGLYDAMPAHELASLLCVHVQTIFKYLNLYNLRQPFRSEAEREIVFFLESNGITNIISNTRKVIPTNKELDIYLPDYKVAIEYNGIYWHHEDIAHIDKDYHWRKHQECEKLGIQLITIFSNFWGSNKTIIKQAILNKLGVVSERIHARKCQIREVSKGDARLFLDNNHVQGFSPSTFKYGLYFNDELVNIMTFGKPRPGMGSLKEKGYELLRYASAKRVVGGASKLLAHFIKTHKPERIISYSNNEWSNGNLYNTLGFTLENEAGPSYWYITPRGEKFSHRYNYAKHKLRDRGYDVDGEKSVKQIIKEIGLLTVWDCGKKTWVLDLT